MKKMTITVQELAEHMGISKPKAYELAKSEGFPAIKVGKRIVIPTDGFKHWLDWQSGKDRRGSG